jgi:small subunit ribosomal protein S20
MGGRQQKQQKSAKQLLFAPKNDIMLDVVRQVKGGDSMPNIKSQKKRVITSKKENARNKAVKSSLRTHLKNAELAIASGEGDAGAVLSAAYGNIDAAARKGVIHKNTANRRKASIAKKANA